jgi:hypothetical protein
MRARVSFAPPAGGTHASVPAPAAPPAPPPRPLADLPPSQAAALAAWVVRTARAIAAAQRQEVRP